MHKREIIATLLTTSNELDAMNMFKEADVLTRAAEMLGDWGPTDPEFNPDNEATEEGFLREKQYDEEEKIRRQMQNEEALMALDAKMLELQQKPNPTQEDIEELERLMKYRYGPDFDENDVKFPMSEDEFVQDLIDAGADIPELPVDENNPFADE